MRAAVTALRSAGAEIRVPAFLALIAEVNEKVGRAAQGLEDVNEALGGGARWRQPCWDAELHRLKGALILRTEPTAGKGRKRLETEAESCFLHALEIARRQRAKTFELRAATSVSRLWASHGNTRQARELLKDTYDWFSEGFETADLKEARALLETLEPARRGRPRKF